MGTKIGVYRRRQTCRICGSNNLMVFLDYGNVPLAGGFLTKEQLEEEKLYPLDIAVCLDCSLVQVLNVIPPETLFTDYRYLSSVTQTLSQHFREYAEVLRRVVSSKDNSFVVEIGCNDGVLLRPLQNMGVKVLGVDPASNVVEVARQQGVKVINNYFTVAVAERIAAEFGKADVITASNVFAHIDDLDEVMRGVDLLLTPHGTFIVEVHYIVDLVESLQFDTVYHEHLCYYSLHALATLYHGYGFEIVDVERLPMHGGSIRVFSQRSQASQRRKSETLKQMMECEYRLGINTSELYIRFGQQVVQYRDRLLSLLLKRKQEGHTLSGYGAAGRATTLLNFCKIDGSMMEYIVDASPFRFGRYVPGVHIPIVPPSTLTERPTDDCLITAWNYRAEIIAKEQTYLARDGTFILPLPQIEIVGMGKHE
jgi:SAM-dependent methyltransferase